MKLSEAFNYSVYFLSANGVDEAEFKSLCLVCSLDEIKNSEYEFHKDDEIIMKKLANSLWRLKSGEPLQYVLGKWDFYESEFFVGKGVLIPRPETEELTHLVIEKAKKLSSPVVYDLCSGSGCIGISVAKAVKNSSVYCVEKSEDALNYLRKNITQADNAVAVEGDVLNPHSIEPESIDIIVSNPPYIKNSDLDGLQKEVQFEPKMALNGGEDGLDFYKKIPELWYPYLKNNGLIFFEISEEQGKDVYDILNSLGYRNVEVKKDMYGNDRIVSAVKK